MPMHSSSLQTRTRRRSLSLVIGANSPALVVMSGTERIYSIPLALIAAMMPAPLSSRAVARARVAVTSIRTLQSPPRKAVSVAGIGDWSIQPCGCRRPGLTALVGGTLNRGRLAGWDASMAADLPHYEILAVR